MSPKLSEVFTHLLLACGRGWASSPWKATLAHQLVPVTGLPAATRAAPPGLPAGVIQLPDAGPDAASLDQAPSTGEEGKRPGAGRGRHQLQPPPRDLPGARLEGLLPAPGGDALQ